ncbi:MAG: HlyC/CorC family transporter [Ruminococcaceae bacterium]|nr:HlyC/CorC family transporter [Oscillospiraceae bacterium]
MNSEYLPYIGIVILIALSAFFSGSEIAYASVNHRRLKKSAEEEGTTRLKTAYYIYENYNKALSTILIGNTLVNLAASSVAAVAFVHLFGPKGAAFSGTVMTVLILIFGEIMPKILASTNSDGFAEAVALPLRFLMWLTTPFVFVVTKFVDLVARLWTKDGDTGPSVTEEELVSIIETVEDEGVIDEEQSDLIQSAIDFAEISAQEIITHRVDMVAIDIDDDMDTIIETAATSQYSRIPVYEDTIDNIIGILFLNHFYKQLVDTPDFSIRDQLMEVCFIHKSMKLPAVLAELKRRRIHMAVVTDEYGGTMGILTMEDVLEQLVGDIWDETDDIEPEFEEVEPNRYEVSGDMSIYEFLDEVGHDSDDFEGDYTTLGGWAIEMLGGYPNVGDSFEYENLTITVTETDDLRVTELNVVARERDNEEDDI